ncbi:MAG: hypothetical protein PHU80_04425 [Kiritimatiellae bacterium]|nr:hypothetical protein [Kiritimatiellia bacterium]
MKNISSNENTRDTDQRMQRQQLLHTVLLSVAVLLIPILTGILLVLAAHKIKATRLPPAAESAVSVANRLYELGTATNKLLLISLRHDLRSKGLPFEEVNLRLWATELSEPEKLFHVNPPENGKMWNWHLSHNGLYAVAVTVQTDELDRRMVGLYDIIQNKWLWHSKILWPDSHGQPYIFNNHLILRYTKNAVRFALELDDAGRIISIDSLGPGQSEPIQPPPPDPTLPGTVVAINNGVTFTVNPETFALCGYASTRLPGLRYAGKGDDNTVFSGNGLLKFIAKEGKISVYDSLTHTALQQIDAWRHNANTRVTGMRTDNAGSHLSVYLSTEFAETPPVKRNWQVTVKLYTGQKETLFNQDSDSPKRQPNLQAKSPDGQWLLVATGDNTLTLSCAASGRIVAQMPLGALGIKGSVNDLSFLEGGRHLLIRQADNFWLLDFVVAKGYGDLLARLATSADQTDCDAPLPPNHRLLRAQPLHDNSFEIDSDTLAYIKASNSPLPSVLTLKAELLAANQAWGYTAAVLEKVDALQEYDTRAPRVNLLLLARCQLLAGDNAKARNTCRTALKKMSADPSPHNRMIRYQLQGLYFAEGL